MMVEEQPAIQMFLAERVLNFFDMHELTHGDDSQNHAALFAIWRGDDFLMAHACI